MRAFRNLIGLSLAAASASCSGRVPPLLEGASAAGGWIGGCAQPAGLHAALALSPQLNARLKERFPVGSPSRRLQAELTREGFHSGGACPEDPSIHAASYVQKTYFLEQATASIYWKTSQNDTIIWTEGFLDFEGL